MYRRQIKSVVLLAILLFSISCFHRLDVREITVSAAISLKDAFKEMGRAYETETGMLVRFNFGASGLLQKQIEAGAPADVYASAGVKQMDALQTGGFINPLTRRNLARNRLVLIVPTKSSFALVSFEGLDNPDLSRLAIGNPKTVPAGQYAQQALKSLDVWDRLESRLVLAENVRQVLDYVIRWEVDAGIVYATDVLISPGEVSIDAQAPEDSHDPILYPIAVVKDTELPGEAQKFIDFTLSSSGQAIMEKYGFLPLR